MHSAKTTLIPGHNLNARTTVFLGQREYCVIGNDIKILIKLIKFIKD
jgi:hypothetical protein